MNPDTKTTEWEVEKMFHKLSAVPFPNARKLTASEAMYLREFKTFITSLLHQSRTELMRKVVERVEEHMRSCVNLCRCVTPEKCSQQHGHPKEIRCICECHKYYSALIKLAEEENIKVE